MNMNAFKNEIRRQALKTIGYTNRDAIWYVDNDCIPNYFEGSDVIFNFNHDDEGLIADIDYVETLTNSVVYAIAEEQNSDDSIPYYVFYIANPFKEDLGITNKKGITTEAVICYNYENGWVYKWANVKCELCEAFNGELGPHFLEIDEIETGDVLADDRDWSVPSGFEWVAREMAES